MVRMAKSHEWARLDGELVSVGITAYAIEQLGDIVYLELPKVGTRTTAGKAFGEIESVKAASELFAPLDGVVSEVHSAIADDLEALSRDAYDNGWMIRIKPDNPAQLEALMTAAQYDEYVKTL